LALATAGSYLGQCTESVTEYLEAYEECWYELDDTSEELVEYEDRTLFSTWNLSLTQVQAQHPEVAELLRLLAYFDNKGINYDLLQAGKESGSEWLSSLTANPRQFHYAMARLHDYSLVEMSENSYYLHTCVHDWTMQALNRDTNSEYFWLAVLCIIIDKVGKRLMTGAEAAVKDADKQEKQEATEMKQKEEQQRLAKETGRVKEGTIDDELLNGMALDHDDRAATLVVRLLK
jgi:hypothetical protein